MAEVIEDLVPIRRVDLGNMAGIYRGPDSSALLIAPPDFDMDLPLNILRPPVDLFEDPNLILGGWRSGVFFLGNEPSQPTRWAQDSAASVLIEFDLSTGQRRTLRDPYPAFQDIGISSRGDIAFADSDRRNFELIEQGGRQLSDEFFEAPPAGLAQFGCIGEEAFTSFFPSCVAFRGAETYIGGGWAMPRIDVFSLAGKYLRTIHPATEPRRKGNSLFDTILVTPEGQLLLYCEFANQMDLCDRDGRPLKTYIWEQTFTEDDYKRDIPYAGVGFDRDGNLWAGIMTWPRRRLYGCYAIHADE